MGKWIDYTVDERLAIIQRVAEDKNIDEVAAEKDWWVTMVLYALFHTKYAKYLLFKGGTSLSKGWHIINRFSEDIDIAFSRDYFITDKKLACANCASNTQIKKFREASQDFMWSEFQDELKCQLSKMGFDGIVSVINTNEEYANRGEVNANGVQRKEDHDKDPSVINVSYPSLFNSDGSEYTIPRVKIEISTLSMEEPFEERKISSLISEVYANEFPDIDSEYTQSIRTVKPTRTFLEKVFLLCEEYQKAEPRTYRMSRHLYDLWKFKSTQYYVEALNSHDLYLAVIRHRKKMYHIGSIDYNNDLPANVSIIPPKNLISGYEADYAKMRNDYIYEDSLPFKELCDQLQNIESDIREIKLLEEL